MIFGMEIIVRFITRLHTGQVTPQEVTQIANDSAALVSSMNGLSLQERQQERLDGIELYKYKAKIIDEASTVNPKVIYFCVIIMIFSLNWL